MNSETGAQDNALLVDDTFTENMPAGRVIGSRAPDGTSRQGVDSESIISIDHGALRLEPLIEPGWSRAGLVYGPYARRNGLAFAISLLNGHNGAQSGPLGQPLTQRFKRWLSSNISSREPKQTIARRLATSTVLRLVRPRAGLLRQLSWWWAIARTPPPINKDNLAIGWLGSKAPLEPFESSHALAITAADTENGELRAHVAERMQPLITGVQNIPLYFVVVLRETGAAYYAASMPDAKGFAPYPKLRPLAIDSSPGPASAYAGLYQSAMGEIGFRSNTRVFGMRIAHIPAFAPWYGSGHAADRLTGAGDLARAELGGPWRCSGSFARSSSGATPLGDALALLTLSEATGLVNVLVERQGPQSSASLAWRAIDEHNHWRLTLDEMGARLSLVSDGAHVVVGAEASVPRQGEQTAMQVLDDGQAMRCFLNGQLLFNGPIVDDRLTEATGVGISASGSALLRSFEAHPRMIEMPASLDLGGFWNRMGQVEVVRDPLTGSGESLSQSTAGNSEDRWQKVLGGGAFVRTPRGGQVDADVTRPNPGRTLYTIDWRNPDFADLEVLMTPPGNRRGEGHSGRGGLVCWQDAANYLVVSVWLDDVFEGSASISSFFQWRGYEDVFDAVWTNVGKRVQWGTPCRLRLCFDGLHYLVRINGEPVLYRALTDVYPDAARWKIHRVGLAANWEWGDDTGTVFRDFIARQ